MKINESILLVVLFTVAIIGIKETAVAIIRESRLNVTAYEMRKALIKQVIMDKKLEHLEGRSIFIVWPEDKTLRQHEDFKFKPRYQTGK